MQEVKLNLLLVGKTVQGKSATANTLLNKEVFEPNSGDRTVIREVDFHTAQFGRYTLQVFDGSGLCNTNMNKEDDTVLAVRNMGQAVLMCPEGFDAFLLVLRFGNRFTSEDKSVLETLKQIFGDTFMDHVIVVLTFGDRFHAEGESSGISFSDWCRMQQGDLNQFFKDCKGRVVLFNNREKDETKKQVQALTVLEVADELQKRKSRYTSQCFQDADAGRQKMILELKAPELVREFHKIHFSLVEDIETHDQILSDSDRENIRKRVQSLRSEIEQDQVKMPEVKLNLLLVGKTGVGKSATANTLLNRKVFKPNSRDVTVTREVDFHTAQFGRYTLQVFDGSGLCNTNMNKEDDTVLAVRNMGQAVLMCPEGFDAFLLVLWFGNRFISEDKSVLETLKQIFGDTFMDHVIVVMTNGDNFDEYMEHEVSFSEWCRRQEEYRLFKDCKERVVLFNNRETDETKKQVQVLKVLEIADELTKNNGRYTSQCFLDAEAGRQKMILELEAHSVKSKFLSTCRSLAADIDNMFENPSDSETKTIYKRIKSLKSEIELYHRRSNMFEDLLELVSKLKAHVDDAVKLQSLCRELETKKGK